MESKLSACHLKWILKNSSTTIASDPRRTRCLKPTRTGIRSRRPPASAEKSLSKSDSYQPMETAKQEPSKSHNRLRKWSASPDSIIASPTYPSRRSSEPTQSPTMVSFGPKILTLNSSPCFQQKQSWKTNRFNASNVKFMYQCSPDITSIWYAIRWMFWINMHNLRVTTLW